MKIALAPKYRMWMFALLPTTLGLGTAALWARSLSWPLSVDANGLTLRHRGRVPWRSIRRIRVWRDYLDGHVSRLEIHRQRGTCKIPVRALRDGNDVAEAILAMFKESRRANRVGRRGDVAACAGDAGRHRPSAAEPQPFQRRRASPQRPPDLQPGAVDEFGNRIVTELGNRRATEMVAP